MHFLNTNWLGALILGVVERVAVVPSGGVCGEVGREGGREGERRIANLILILSPI